MGNLQELFIFLNKDAPPMRNPSLGPVHPEKPEPSKPQDTKARLWDKYKTAQRDKKIYDAENQVQEMQGSVLSQVEEAIQPRSNEVPM